MNIGASIISKIILLLVALFMRRLLILYIGNEVNGLNSLYASIIGVLAVAELGVGSAIIFSMYRPIVKGDNKKVAALYCLYRRLYRIIGLAIFVAGLTLMPFLPSMISDYSALDVNVYLTFFLTLVSVVISYLYSAKTALIEAYKDNYINTAIATISRMVRYALQIAAIIIWKSFVIFLVCQIIETIIVWYFTERVARKLHPEILAMREDLDQDSKREITRNIKAMIMHKVGDVLTNGVDSTIISIFLGVVILGKYTNYTAVAAAISGVIVLFFVPVTSVVGHMSASKEPGEIRRYFDYFNSMNFILGMIFFLGYYAVADTFVAAFFGRELTMVRVVPFVITLNSFTRYMRQSVLLFKNANGKFYYDRWKPIADGVTNIILSVLFVNIFPKEFGVVGVIAATIVTCLVICYIVEPHIVFKYVFKEPATKFYLYNYGRVALFVLCMLALDRLMISSDNSIMEMLANGMISVGISVVAIVILAIVSKGFRRDARVLISQARQWCRKVKGRLK